MFSRCSSGPNSVKRPFRQKYGGIPRIMPSGALAGQKAVLDLVRVEGARGRFPA